MREESGDLWVVNAEAHVITTNGYVKKNGEGVMGRGVALQAAQRFPWIAGALGRHLQHKGNHVGWAATVGFLLVFFPVKHHWREQADLGLIRRSARELAELAGVEGWVAVAMPRPGCGNGGRSWDVVRPLIEPFLDDRFIVVQSMSGR